MINRSILISCVLYLALIHAACNRNDKPAKRGIFRCLIKDHASENFVTSYLYDDNDRIKKETTINEFQGFEDFTTYDYSIPGKVFIINKSKLLESEITLNFAGDIKTKKETQFISRDPDEIFIVRTTEFIYNDDGYLVKSILSTVDNNTSDDDVTEYTITDGDLLKEKYSRFNGNTTTWNYTYFDEMPNTFADFERKREMTGLKTKNMLKSVEKIVDGDPPVIFTYTYGKDYNDNIDSMTVATTGQGNILTTYTWDCRFK